MDGNPVGLEASEAGSFGWNQLGESFFFFLNLDLVWFIGSEFRWGQGFHIACSALLKKRVCLRKGL